MISKYQYIHKFLKYVKKQSILKKVSWKRKKRRKNEAI